MKTTKEITPDMEKNYIQLEGGYCPFCGSDNITASHPDLDTCITIDVECGDCGEEWVEEYLLTGISKL